MNEWNYKLYLITIILLHRRRGRGRRGRRGTYCWRRRRFFPICKVWWRDQGQRTSRWGWRWRYVVLPIVHKYEQWTQYMAKKIRLSHRVIFYILFPYKWQMIITSTNRSVPKEFERRVSTWGDRRGRSNRCLGRSSNQWEGSRRGTRYVVCILARLVRLSNEWMKLYLITIILFA